MDRGPIDGDSIDYIDGNVEYREKTGFQPVSAKMTYHKDAGPSIHLLKNVASTWSRL